MQKRKLIKLFFVCCVLFGCKNISAQSNLFFKNFTPILFPIKATPFVLNTVQQNQVSCLQLSSNTKQPMFCRMEDKLHNRLNVWIKFRTGSDEFYRTLIALPRETTNKLSD